MIRPVKPDELEEMCRRITSMEPWLRLEIKPEDLIAGMRIDTIRHMLVSDDEDHINGAAIYRAQHGAELLFFHNFGEVLARRYGVEWPCEWTDVPNFGYIGSLAVFDQMTGQGIGQKLLDAALDRIREDGVGTEAYLCVSEFNHRARSFYERNGFQFRGEAQGRRSVEHLMEKAL